MLAIGLLGLCPRLPDDCTRCGCFVHKCRAYQDMPGLTNAEARHLPAERHTDSCLGLHACPSYNLPVQRHAQLLDDFDRVSSVAFPRTCQETAHTDNLFDIYPDGTFESKIQVCTDMRMTLRQILTMIPSNSFEPCSMKHI